MMMTSLTVEEHNNATQYGERRNQSKTITISCNMSDFLSQLVHCSADHLLSLSLAQRVQIIIIPRPIIILYPHILVIPSIPNMV
jgi:hypothetical protein